jgi:hypothetical protein
MKISLLCAVKVDGKERQEQPCHESQQWRGQRPSCTLDFWLCGCDTNQGETATTGMTFIRLAWIA